MKIKNNSNNKLIKFFNGKGFYIVAAISLLAIGVAAWTAVASLRDITSVKKNTGNATSQVESSTKGTDTAGTSSTDKKSVTSSKNSGSKKTESDAPKIAEAANTAADYFIMPVSGGEVLKNFSDSELQYSLTYCDMRIHKALDIKADRDTPVYACGEGTVTAVTADPLLGTVIKVDHGNGITVNYCGLHDNTVVKAGDTVNSSIIVGTVDTIPCESVEQTHLHLEFYKDGIAVSPLDYIAE